MNLTDLIGKYTLEGNNQNPEGTPYRGTLTLTLKGDCRLDAVWHIHPDQMQFGVGFFKNGLLVVNFYYVGDAQETFHGVVAYTCLPNGLLKGVWSEEMGDSKYVGVENARKMEPEFLN